MLLLVFLDPASAQGGEDAARDPASTQGGGDAARNPASARMLGTFLLMAPSVPPFSPSGEFQ